MKKLMSVFLVIFSLGIKANEIKINQSKIDNVTVFLKGAEINRTGKFFLKAGVSTVVFENLGNGILLNSIQAKGKGDFTILDVKQGSKYERTSEAKDFTKTELQILELNDSLSFLRFEFEDIKFEQEVIKGEKQLIVNNPSYKTMVDSFATFKEYTQFYKKELKLINQQLVNLNRLHFNLKRKEKGFKVKQAALQSLITNSEKPIVKRINTISVTVSSLRNLNGSILLKYTVPNAGWKPMYDIRIDEKGASTKLVYKAKVFQNSGINWKGVNLTLSTSDPYQVFIAPQLNTHYLDYYSEVVHQSKRKTVYNDKDFEVLEEMLDDIEISKSVENKVSPSPVRDAVEFTSIQQNLLDVEYKINLKYDIEQGNIERLVLINEVKISTNFKALSIPKVSHKTYSIAQLIGWEDLEIVPGKAQIFFENSYVGETYLNPNILKDTFDVILGIDKRVVITKNHVKTEEKESLSGSKIKKTYTYDFVIKNNKNRMVQINLFDQIPVSKRKEIEIELLEQTGAEFDKKSGKLKWDLTLQKGEIKNVSFKFSIKYLKDKNIT